MNVLSSLAVRRCILTTRRGFAVRRRVPYVAPAPGHTFESIQLPEDMFEEPERPDPIDDDAYHRKPVTSAHMVDVKAGKLSTKDSVALTPEGAAIHGRYGDLGADAEGIPLEYLALLHPAAEGAAALRVTLEKAKHKGPGTILVYGASQPSAFAAAQLANAAGHTVVAVVGCEHSGHDGFMEVMKGMLREPGTAVAEQYAACKAKFRELVHSISTGDEGQSAYTASEYLEEFKENLLAYAEAYPDTRVAAVSESHFKLPQRESEREYFSENMEAYWSQFPPGSPKFDKEKLDQLFTKEQYAVFRDKFWKQSTDIITNDGLPEFSAPHIVKQLMESPEQLDETTYPTVGPEIPYSFPILRQTFGEGVDVGSGGPILGAILAVTPFVETPAKAVADAKGLRAKAEALQFLTKTQRVAFYGASAVANLAKQHGAPILVTGGTNEYLTSFVCACVEVLKKIL